MIVTVVVLALLQLLLLATHNAAITFFSRAAYKKHTTNAHACHRQRGCTLNQPTETVKYKALTVIRLKTPRDTN